MNYTSRFTTLLGECRRQMNGAVVGSMRYYGAEYGLNYGVSLPTLRTIAEMEEMDYDYAKYLYQQQVREIRLISFWVAEPSKLIDNELSFWAEGIINSEVAEEASFALFQHTDIVEKWLDSDNELLIYTALLSISKARRLPLEQIIDRLVPIIDRGVHILRNAVITLLDSYYQNSENRVAIALFLEKLPSNSNTDYIIEEMNWRCDCCE